MGFEEFQRQQKALKELDREKKNAATAGLNSYKGGEHDIKHERALADIREVARMRKISAVRNHNGHNDYYQHPRWSSPNKDSQDSRILHGKEEEIQEKEGKEMSFGVWLDGEDDDKAPAANTNSCLRTPRGIEADKRADVADKGIEAQKVAVEATVNGEKAEKAAAEEAARCEADSKQVNVEEAANKAVDAEAARDAEKPAALKYAAKATVVDKEDTNRAAIEALADQWSRVALEGGSSTTTDQGMSMHHGCRIELEFKFGIFYLSTQPPPEWDVCVQAAAGIVPNKIRMGETPVSYHSEFPPVVKTIAKDDAFVPGKSEKGLFRYTVRGIVPVFLKEEDKVEIAPIRRSLKKHTSFVPVQHPTEKETIVENEQGDQWKRVREGKPVAWEEIVEKSPCSSTLH